MLSLRRLCASVTVVVLAAGSLVTSTVAATATPPAADAHARWVTLITGDRVLVRPSGKDLRVVTVEPGKGRRGMAFDHRTRDGWHYVIPADAQGLVAANVVDKRLFNVSLLLRWGYDDRGRTTLPLLVAGGTAGLRSERAVPSIGAAAVALEKKGATQFWAGIRPAGRMRALAGGVTRVWLDGKVEAVLDRTVPQIGAPEAWQSGYTGAGVKVAVLDSGIDATHPDLVGAVVGERDFTGSATGARDLLGHGTHVAGIITGDGAASGGRYKGVAPDATLLNAKVLMDNGFGLESWLIAGMEWAVEQGARVVSMSVSATGSGDDAVGAAVDRLTQQTGALFVAAAGNSGPGEGTVSSPGTAALALTVGAVDRQDVPAGFSSRGPSESRAGIKPDIMAPGVGVVSALAPGSQIARHEPVVDGHYVALSGTSMATPHVSGAAALLAGKHPGWRAEQLKGVLMASATGLDGVSVHTQGAGRVDVARAVRQQPVFASPSSVDVGVALWPHGDDVPVDTTLTYHNDGDAPVTLNLSPRMRGPAGDAPAGMFTVTPAELVVPARGTATARLTSDTRVDAPDGRYEGTVVATGGGAAVRTPVALLREVESYEVTVTGYDASGGTPYELEAVFFNVDTGDHHGVTVTDGVQRARLPRGTYFVVAAIVTPIGDPEEGQASKVLMAEPTYVVDGPRTLTVDARKAKPIALRLDRPDAAVVGTCLIGFFRTIAGEVSSDEAFGPVGWMSVIPSSTSAPADQFTYQVIAQAARSDGNGGFTNSPYAYLVDWKHPGSVPDLVPRIRDAGLARVTHRIATSGPNQRAWFGPIGPLTVPGTITQLVTPDLPSFTAVGIYVGERTPDDGYPDIAYYSAEAIYRPGETTQRRWNVGVFAPTLIDHHEFVPYLARGGNRLWAGIPLSGSGVGGQAGISRDDTMRLALFKDGVLIGESPYQAELFEVPDDPGAYRLEATATRSVSSFSTSLSAAWMFRSSKVDGVLPMLTVGFRPPLDDHNRAQAGRLATFPVSVSQAPGADAGRVTTLTVDFSFDDGRTWHPARVTGSGADRSVTVVHPPGVRFVSLRTKASTDLGITAELTVVRAYGLR